MWNPMLGTERDPIASHCRFLIGCCVIRHPCVDQDLSVSDEAQKLFHVWRLYGIRRV